MDAHQSGSGFNSIKVRLERHRRAQQDCRSTFQFHKGTIRTWEENETKDGEPKFQFHKGTIRTHTYERKYLEKSCFNSIKVRLERRSSPRASCATSRFQFHKGTIRTAHRVPAQRALVRFQFHKGTIRTPGMVDAVTVTSVFQFHKGTIRTCACSRLHAVVPR